MNGWGVSTWYTGTFRYANVECLNYRPQRSCGLGTLFTPVCHSFCSQGEGHVCLSGCWDTTPPSRHPLAVDTPPGADTPGSRPPSAETPLGADFTPEQTPPKQTPPLGPYPPRLSTPLGFFTPFMKKYTPPRISTPPRSMTLAYGQASGRYASYWNAILVLQNMHIV